MRILVIEDEKKVAEFVARGLRSHRFAVDISNDGQSGWEMAKACNYDLIILDLMLPGLGGTEVLKRIRQHGARYDYQIQHAALDFDGAAGRVNDAAKLDDEAIAEALHDAAVVGLDGRI